MIQKGIVLLAIFAGFALLLTFALSIIMKSDSLAYRIFLYVFSVSQLFLFLHSLLYWYYTTGKSKIDYRIKKRSENFDKKTLVIISAYNEDSSVLESTFNAVKKSFQGPIMLAVDSPVNVSSYIELCRNYDIICIHRIHRSGFKAGAINNVVLNFLRNQPGYIKKTKKELADEIVSVINNSLKTLSFELLYDLENLKRELSTIDKTIESSYSNYIYKHISQLASGKQTDQLQPKDLEIFRSQIVTLRKKIDIIMVYYNNSYAKLSTLNKIITPINNAITKLSPDVSYLESEIESTFNQLQSMQKIQLISVTEDCIKNLNNINEQNFTEFIEKRKELFSIMTYIGTKLDYVGENTALEKNNTLSSSASVTAEETNLDYNSIKKLQSNLKTLDNMLVSLDKTIESSYSNYIYKHISHLTSDTDTDHLRPRDLSLLRDMIQNQRNKLNDIDKNVESLYEKNSYDSIEQLTSDKQTKFLQLEDLSLLHSKIDDLEKKVIVTNMQTDHLPPKNMYLLRDMIQNQRNKLNDIDKNVESLYEKNLYDSIEQLTSDKQTKFLQLEDFNLLHSKMEDLEKEFNEFYDLTKYIPVSDFIPNLRESLTNLRDNIFNREKFLVSENIKNNIDKIEDLLSEFNYTANDLVDKIPLNVSYIVLLDSDAHPKSDADPENNFFDLAATYIQENDLLVFPQFYNKDGGKLVRAAYAQQVPFMKTIMPKRGEDNTAFMLGTNIMVKKQILESVNGFDDSTVTEDLATTIKIHESKAKSKYINKDVVVNGAPLSITGYFTQQQRWAYGTFQVFFTMLLRGIGNDLKWKSFIEYLYGNTWYFYGLTFIINALIPFYSIFWEGLIQIPENLFFVLYLPYVFSGLLIFFYSVLRTGHGFKDVFYNMSLNAICFFVYIRALILILSKQRLPFEVTPKSGTSEETILRYKKISPVLIVMGLLGLSVVIYVIRIINGEVSIIPGLINIIWSSFFISLLAPVLTFK